MPNADVTKLHDFLKDRDYGELVTYDELTAHLGYDLRELPFRGPLYQVIDLLLANDSRALANVRSEGYRVLEPKEHAAEARRKQREARMKLRRGVRTVKATARAMLTEAENADLDSIHNTLEFLVEVTAAHEQRFETLEDRMAALEAMVKKTGLRPNKDLPPEAEAG